MAASIANLTPQQTALIPFYRQKWLDIAVSTQPIERSKAAMAVKSAYAAIGYNEPEIIFCESPFVGLIPHILWLGSDTPLSIQLQEKLGEEFGEMYHFQELSHVLLVQIQNQLKTEIFYFLDTEISATMSTQFSSLELANQILEQQESQMESIVRGNLSEEAKQLLAKLLGEELESLLEIQREYEPDDELLADSTMWQIDGLSQLCILTTDFACNASLFDFCSTVLNCDRLPNIWTTYQSLIENCGWIYPYEKVCIICDRPRLISLDDRHRLHALASPAMQFADGFSLYAYHGVRLPEKYGKLHPNQWQSVWLLEEENAELRRVLIQGIGYQRIILELGATELDTFQEYSLLKIDRDIDLEPIYLLKMTCPSTGYIHVLRVPPDVKSARKAIRWVNWGIDPQEFSVQT